MFGYVKPYIPTLQVQEYELYRAVYCGLCREMGKITGQVSRLTLSYDFCFLALLLLSLSDVPSRTEPVRCPVHPVKKRIVIASHPALSVTSTAAAWLVDGKRRDDLADERGIRRLKPLLSTPLCAVMRSKVQKTPYGVKEAAENVRAGLAQLSALENAGCDSAEKAAQCFGEMLSALFVSCGKTISEDPAAHAILAECGLRTGRFLYLCDAMDDLTEDARRGRYNPLLRLYGDYAIADDRPTDMVRDGFRIAATVDLCGLGRAIELLPYPEAPYTRILKNIVYAGMPQVARNVAAGVPSTFHSPVSDPWEDGSSINLPEKNPAQE